MPRLIWVFAGCTSHFSSPEPKAHWWAYSIGRPLSSVCMYVCQHFQTSSPLKPLGWLKPNFMWSLLGMGERKFVQMVQVTWPRWPPCSYMVKTLKSLFLRNQKAYDLETWYATLGTRILPSLFKWWHWVDLDLFYRKVKFVPYAFIWENGKTMDFSETIVVYDIKAGRFC